MIVVRTYNVELIETPEFGTFQSKDISITIVMKKAFNLVSLAKGIFSYSTMVLYLTNGLR